MSFREFFKNHSKLVLWLAVLLVLAGMMGYVAYEEEATLSVFSPEDRRRFAGFRGDLGRLEVGDIVSAKNPQGEPAGYMVVRWNDNQTIVLQEGPPRHLDRKWIILVRTPDLIDLYRSGVTITRKTDPGYQRLTEWYFLQ